MLIQCELQPQMYELRRYKYTIIISIDNTTDQLPSKLDIP